MLQDTITDCYRVVSLYVTGSCHCMLQDTIIACYRVVSLYVTGYQRGLVLINQRNGQRYQRVLALWAFFFFFFLNRGNTEGTNSSKMLCLIFLYVCFV